MKDKLWDIQFASFGKERLHIDTFHDTDYGAIAIISDSSGQVLATGFDPPEEKE